MEIATTGSLEVKLLTRTGAATVVGAVREEIQSEERRLKVAEKVKKNRNALCFSNVFWLRRVEKVACQSSGCGAIWGDEK